MAAVTKAVILAAGLGTRMLPATRAIPKEMLPVVDKPLIQYAVEECVAAGIEHVIFVVTEGKDTIREHFAAEGRVAAWAQARGNTALAAAARLPGRLARFDYVTQEGPLGIAHAVSCARAFVEGEAFALLFPDDLILAAEPVTRQLSRVYEACGGSVVAVMEVPREEIPQYCIVDPAAPGNPARLRGVIEKPSPERAPSALGIVGRYILSPSIFRHIDGLTVGAGGELQITDALASEIASGGPVWAFAFEGARFDTGRPAGLLVASVAAALRRPELAPALRVGLGALLERPGC
ncbi:MAG: UTP--glucose-1-phosphate uridylyltransferase [Tepidiformaceae bacterium]